MGVAVVSPVPAALGDVEILVGFATLRSSSDFVASPQTRPQPQDWRSVQPERADWGVIAVVVVVVMVAGLMAGVGRTGTGRVDWFRKRGTTELAIGEALEGKRAIVRS